VNTNGLITLDSFDEQQQAAVSNSLHLIQEEWVPFSETVIGECLENVFDFYTVSVEDYLHTEMGRFEQLVYIVMEDELQRLVRFDAKNIGCLENLDVH
jgi:hypothetical protein